MPFPTKTQLTEDAWSGNPVFIGDSSCIRTVAYSSKDKVLIVNFQDGKSYTYYEVPTLVYANLLRATSKGFFFNRYIRNNYNFDED
jgi:hypothetical protein